MDRSFAFPLGRISLPPALARTWACRGDYGTVSFNVRAIYQRYLGFFDGNPAHLDELPPAEAGRRYVELAGGLDALLDGAAFAHLRGEASARALGIHVLLRKLLAGRGELLFEAITCKLALVVRGFFPGDLGGAQWLV